MKPQDDYRNGDDGGGSGDGASASDDEGSSGSSGGEDELTLEDPALPARALNALNALRKARQHYDAVLLAEGAEVPAHRAVLAAASPYLLRALGEAGAAAGAGAGAAAAALRVEGVDADALRALVEWAYTGRVRVRGAAAARRLYGAAWRLRVEPLRARLAERLARRPAPAAALPLRALPDLEPHLRADLDAYIAQNFEEIMATGALAALPRISIEMVRESSASGGAERPQAVAAAALAWLRERQAADADLEELCSRTHLLFVDARGALRDCGELPEASGQSAALGSYRREAIERAATHKEAKTPPDDAPALGSRTRRAAAADECCVVAVRAGEDSGGRGGTHALVSLRGRLAAARVTWRTAGPGITRGGVLGGAEAEAEAAAEGGSGGVRIASLSHGRCALGVAALGARLVACGGYDRARVHQATEAYDPLRNVWEPLPDMRTARARFPVALVGDTLFALGGSDGHADLASVDALAAGAWSPAAQLPHARTHAGAAAAGRALFVLGGWAGGLSLRRVDRYEPDKQLWTEAPPLITGRSQCAGVAWAGALWALGGCDAWHCLASTETLQLDQPNAVWTQGPPLPTARRSVGGAAWRGLLVSVGGSDGAASLRRTDWLSPGGSWRPGPPLRRARAALGLGALGDALYAVGGFDGKEFLRCVEALRHEDGAWTALCERAGPAPPPPPRQEVKENGVVEPAQ